jgi:MerR family transcriptional regulator, repressor of the yfmOP operon
MQVDDAAYRIGEVADRVGVTTRTIRYYEELGLLGCGDRTKGAHRTYSETDIARLEELIRLRDLLGLSLEELTGLAEAEEARAALRDQWESHPDDAERLRILEDAIPLVERQLELLRSRRSKVDRFAKELDAKLKQLHEKRLELAVSPARR